MSQNIKHIVALSGGKDSVAMALRLKQLNRAVDYEYVITPTGDELPEMVEHWKKIEQRLGKKMTRINNLTLEQCIKQEKMIPNFRARFCTRILKIEPFIDYMNTLPPGSVLYVGLRADEEGRLGLVQPDSVFAVICPMRDWGWTINDVYDFLENQNFTIPDRTDCGSCFFQRLGEWKELLEKHPDRYEGYVQIEKKRGHTFRSPGRDTWPADLYGLREAFLSGRKIRKTNKRNKETKCRFCTM